MSISDDHVALRWKRPAFTCFMFIELQHMSSDPMTAVNEAVEGFTDKMSSLNDIFNNAHGKFNHVRWEFKGVNKQLLYKLLYWPTEYVPAVITDPVAAVDQWADASTSFLLGIHGDVLGVYWYFYLNLTLRLLAFNIISFRRGLFSPNNIYTSRHFAQCNDFFSLILFPRKCRRHFFP